MMHSKFINSLITTGKAIACTSKEEWLNSFRLKLTIGKEYQLRITEDAFEYWTANDFNLLVLCFDQEIHIITVMTRSENEFLDDLETGFGRMKMAELKYAPLFPEQQLHAPTNQEEPGKNSN